MNSKSVKEGGIKSMYSKSKRFIASFLTVLMAVCMLPVDVAGVAYAEELSATQTDTFSEAAEQLNTTVETENVGEAPAPLYDAASLTGCTVVLETAPENGYTYTGSQIKPEVVKVTNASDEEVTLGTKGVDYEVTYTNNINVGTSATVTVSALTGSENVSDSASATFEIKALDLSTTTVTASGAAGAAPDVEVKVGGVTVPKSDYVLSYSYTTESGNETDITKVPAETDVTITVNPSSSGNCTGSTTQIYKTAAAPIVKKELSATVITIGADNAGITEPAEGKTNYTTSFTAAHTGSAITPDVTVKLNAGDSAALEKGKDYSVEYNNNTNVGKNATITITALPTSDVLVAGRSVVIEFEITENKQTGGDDDAYAVTGTLVFTNNSVAAPTAKDEAGNVIPVTAALKDETLETSIFTLVGNLKAATETKSGTTTFTNSDNEDESVSISSAYLKTGGSMGYSNNAFTNAIKFETKAPAKVSVLYDPQAKTTDKTGRYVKIVDSNNEEIAKDTEHKEAVKLWVNFDLDAAGTYYLGSGNSGIWIYKVIVKERTTPIEKTSLEGATVALTAPEDITDWAFDGTDNTKWNTTYNTKAIIPNVEVTLKDGTNKVPTADIATNFDVTYARKDGTSEPQDTDYKPATDETLDFTNAGTIYVKVAAKATSTKYENGTTAISPVSYEIKKAAKPTIAAGEYTLSTGGEAAKSINLNEVFGKLLPEDAVEYSNPTLKAGDQNVLASDPELAITDKVNLTLKSVTEVPADGQKKATVTVTISFANYEDTTVDLVLGIADKTEVEIESIKFKDSDDATKVTYTGEIVKVDETGFVIYEKGDASTPATEADDGESTTGKTNIAANLAGSLDYTWYKKAATTTPATEGDAATGATYEKIDNAPTNAGSYKVTVSVKPSANYTGSADFEFDIEQATLTVKAKNRVWGLGYPSLETSEADTYGAWYTVEGWKKADDKVDDACGLSVTYEYKINNANIANWSTVGETDTIVIVPTVDMTNATALTNYKFTAEGVENGSVEIVKDDAVADPEKTHVLNFTKDWHIVTTKGEDNKDYSILKTNKDNSSTDGYFTLGDKSVAKTAGTGNAYALIEYKQYKTPLKGDSNATVTFTAQAGSTVEMVANIATVSGSGINVYKGYTSDKSKGTAVSGLKEETLDAQGGIAVLPYKADSGNAPSTKISKFTVNITDNGTYTIARTGGEFQLYYVKVTEAGSQQSGDNIEVTYTISDADKTALAASGASLFFTPTDGTADVPVDTTTNKVTLKQGKAYTLVAKKNGVVDEDVIVKINNGTAEYTTPSTATATITISITVAKSTVTITPTIDETAQALGTSKVHFIITGEDDKEVTSATPVELKKNKEYNLVVIGDDGKLDETKVAKIDGNTTYTPTEDKAVTITISAATPATKYDITLDISDADKAKLGNSKVSFVAAGEKVEVDFSNPIKLRENVKYTIDVTPSVTSDGKTINVKVNGSTEFTPTANATVTLTVELTSSTQPPAPSDIKSGFNVELDPDNDDKLIEKDDDGNYIYTGSAIKPAITVYNGAEKDGVLTAETLIEGVDYTVRYANNVNASTRKPATLTVTGKGRFSGSQTVNFNIAKKSLGDAVTDKIEDGIEIGKIVIAKGSKAAPVIIYNGVKLANKDIVIPNTRYNTVTTNETPDEEKTVVITAKETGNFTGSLKLPVTVVEKTDLKKYQLKVALSRGVTYTYDGTEKDVSLDVKNGSGVPVVDEDHNASDCYYVSYNTKNRTDAGVVKFTVYGIGDYTGSVSKSFTIKPADKTKTTVNITGEQWTSGNYEVPYTCTGATLDSYFDDDIEVKATIEGITESLTLKKDRDYKVTYSANKKAGTAKAIVSFIGNYKGIAKKQTTFTIKGREIKAEIGDEALTDINLDVKFGTTKPYKNAGIYKAPVIISMDGVTVKNSEFNIKYYTEAADPENGFAADKEMSGRNKLTIPADSDAKSATVYVELTGKDRGNFKGSKITGQYQVYKEATYDLSRAAVTFNIYDAKKAKYVKSSSLPYTGEPIVFGSAEDETDQKPYLEVKVGGKPVPANAYKVEYVNNTLKGRATVIIVPNTDGERTAAGCKTVNFTIAALNLKNYKNVLADLFHIGTN